MFSCSCSEKTKDNTTQLMPATNYRLIEDAILSPRPYASFDSPPHNKAKSFDSYSQFNSQLHEKKPNLTSNEFTHSRFPHTTPSNKIRTNGISYYYLPDNSFQKKRKTLVINLDETLIHSSFKKPFLKHDFSMTIEYNNQYYPIFVSKRPYLNEFLEKAAAKYELVIFTASVPKYANVVIDSIDPKKLISHRLYREHCTKNSNGSYTKELKRIGRDLKGVIILDNNPESYGLNSDNALPIETWLYNRTDKELMKIGKVLDFLAEEEDVRPIINTIVTRHDKIDYGAVDKMIDERKKQMDCIGNDMTYELNSNYNDVRHSKPKSNYNKIDYPSYIKNSSFNNSDDNKSKIKIDNLFNEFNIKRNKDKYSLNNTYSSSKHHSPIKSTTTTTPRQNYTQKYTSNTIEQITRLKREIEHTKKYFTNVK